jgi:murein DD-endopeptidase / murein LD-carboxypeptidase
MRIILKQNKYSITIISLLFVFLIFHGCKSTKQSRKQDRISDNFELYLSVSEKGSYREYSQKFGYTLNGNENEKLLKEIISWLGTPYLYGGATRRGADCSGFAKEVYKAVYGIDLFRSTSDMVKNGRRINNKSRLQEGDLVFFRISGRNISHVGIYISNGYFAHASTSRGVVVDNLEQKYYADRFAFGGRVL